MHESCNCILYINKLYLFGFDLELMIVFIFQFYKIQFELNKYYDIKICFYSFDNIF